jgi:hypothetical protein
VKVSKREDGAWRVKRRTTRALDFTRLFIVTAALLLATIFPAQGDEWVTKKNPKHGYKLLGRVILMVEVRSDGTVKRAWPAAANVRSRAAWRAAQAAQTLTFRPGSERTVRMPVTVYLD